MRVIFAGTPEAAVPTLELLHSSGHEVVAVVTRPDAPRGRKRVITPSPVAVFAQDHGIPIIKARSIETETAQAIAELEADLGVVVAYGAFLPEHTLHATKHGWINLHFSRLPEFRGAAPVQWTLIAGHEQAHTTVFKLVKDMDAGPIVSVDSTQLCGTETATELLATLGRTGASQTLKVVDDIDRGNAVFVEQEGTISFAPKISLEQAELDPSLDGKTLLNLYRGVTEEPGAWFTDGEIRVKVLEASRSDRVIEPGVIEVDKQQVFWGTATTALLFTLVQPAGKAAMKAADWARGRR